MEDTQKKVIEEINNKKFYRYYPVSSMPYDVSIDESNRYGNGIYFLDNPYYYKNRFDNARVVIVKPKLKNPLVFFNDDENQMEYNDMLLSSITNGEVKNRHEFTEKMIKNGYDALVIHEPRGVYLLLFADDKNLYETISDTMTLPVEVDKMAVGGVISPLPFVSASAIAAIKEVLALDKYKVLSEMEASIIYGKWKNDKDAAVWMDTDKTKLQASFIPKLEEKGYIETDYYANSDEYTLTEKGKDFIETVTNRYLTRLGVKKGTDLFPDEANIKEVDLAKEKLKKSWSAIGSQFTQK